MVQISLFIGFSMGFRMLLISLLLISSIVSSKELKIIKCIQANGTVAFQEKTCDKKVSTTNKVVKDLSRIKPLITPSHQNTNYQPTNKNNVVKVTNNLRGYLFSIDALKHWNITNKVINQKLLHMEFVDNRSDYKFSMLIDYIYPDNKKFSIQELNEILYLSASRYAKGSVQNQLNLYQLKVKNGEAVVTTLSNSDALRDYSHLTKGLIYKGEWLIQFTIKSNSLINHNYAFAMNALAQTINIRR